MDEKERERRQVLRDKIRKLTETMDSKYGSSNWPDKCEELDTFHTWLDEFEKSKTPKTKSRKKKVPKE